MISSLSFESLIALIPLVIAWFSFSIWMHDRDNGENDARFLTVSLMSGVIGIGLLAMCI